jgi:hypothetical protein
MEQTTITATGKPAILLEPKDLRIGNILLYKGEYVHVTTLSMDIDDEYQETIGFCKVGETTNEIADWNRALCVDLSPVEITPEILEKSCDSFFPGGENPFYIFKVNKQGELVIFTGTSLVGQANGIDKNDFYFSFNGVLIILKYLHQIQNLIFSLAGKELKVNLSQCLPSQS